MYRIQIKLEGIEKRRRSAMLFHIISGFFLLVKTIDYYRLSGFKNFLYMIPFLLFAIVSLLYGFMRKKIDPDATYNYLIRLIQLICFSVLGILLTRTGNTIEYAGAFVFALLSILLFFSEKRIFQNNAIRIDDAGINIPGDYKEHLVKWTDLSQVVVREDFITIFHLKQKFLQYQVSQDLSELELININSFCKKKLEQSTLASTLNL